MPQIADLNDLDFALQHEHARAGRYGGIFCLIFLRIGDYGKVITRYGLDPAERLITDIGALISRNIRTCDRIFLYSESEYIILLPNTPKEGGKRAALKLQNLLEQHKIIRRLPKLDFSVTTFPSTRDSARTDS